MQKRSPEEWRALAELRKLEEEGDQAARTTIAIALTILLLLGAAAYLSFNPPQFALPENNPTEQQQQ